MGIKPRQLFCALCAFLGSLSAATAEPAEYDPASVSEGLKAIFQYGSGTKPLADRLNANTVTVVSGTIGGTYVQIAADLATMLDDGDKFRILPIVGRGSVQSIADILFLRGVDAGIVRADSLKYLEEKGYAKNVRHQLSYITKLYNEEVQVIAPKSIHSMQDLQGKTVSVDLPNGGSFITASFIFERLGIKANFVYLEQRLAYEKMRKGELDAVLAVQGRPSRAITQISDDNLHFLPIDYVPALQEDYLPARLTSEDYPNLIAKGDAVDTIAIGAVLAAYNWPENSERYRRLEKFVNVFFPRIEEFQRPPFHPKWTEVNLSAQLPGWDRFKPAAQWLEHNSNAAATKETKKQFNEFLADRARRAGTPAPNKPDDREALFLQFLDWQKKQPVRQ
jgi:TRAP transporter TAXI family solute receptor